MVALWALAQKYAEQWLKKSQPKLPNISNSIDNF